MAEDQSSGRDALPDSLVATLADPATGRSRVPYLLTVLDDGDPRHRLVAGTALCLVAETDPEIREAVAERLFARLDGNAHDEVGYALEYLAARHPEAVEAAVETLDGDAEGRVRDHRSRSGADGGFLRSEYFAPGDPDRPVGRTRARGESDVDDSRQVYAPDDAERTEKTTPESEEEHSNGDDEHGDDPPLGESDSEGPSGGGTVEGGPRATAVTLRAVSRRLSEIVARSKFDELTVLTEGRRDRYGVVYRSAGRMDGEEYAVALTVYRLPADQESFVAGFRTAVDQWEAVDSHRALLPVYDWGVRPRPWATVEYAGESLATRSDPPNEPLWTVLELASGVVHAHQHGLVHGAIDPGNVVYRDAVLDEHERRQPLLSNPQIATLSGRFGAGNHSASSDDTTASGGGPDPAASSGDPDNAGPGGIDPRYAAPEHYDDSYGRVDGATDVYGLGTLLFRLCTDHHPYTGDAATVRGKVLSDEAPDPRRVNPELPDSLHRVVRKATATRKLKRYETVTAFERELTQARQRLLEAVDDA